MPFEVINKSEDVGEIRMYGVIWDSEFWGDEVTPTKIIDQLDKLKNSKEINVYINSDGGAVSAGIAIYNNLKAHPANITVYIDGMAASIAGVIAMAGDKIMIAKNAMFMVHKAASYSYGNSTDFRKMADVLDKFDETIVNTFVDRTGQSKEQIISLMEEETYMTGEEAVAFGFADELIPNKSVNATNVNGETFVNGIKVDVSRFTKLPKNLFKNEIPKTEPAIEPEEQPEPVDFSIYDKQGILNNLLQQFTEVL
jgi:ATP-dependent Clp protease, protease subunit